MRKHLAILTMSVVVLLSAGHALMAATFPTLPNLKARWLASAGEDTTIMLWDASNLSKGAPTPTRRHTLRGHTGMVMSLAFNHDGSRLVSASRDSTVKVWDMKRWSKAAGR